VFNEASLLQQILHGASTSKYCDIKRLPSTAALLAIPVGLHRARQRAAYLTPTSLMPYWRQNFSRLENSANLSVSLPSFDIRKRRRFASMRPATSITQSSMRACALQWNCSAPFLT